MMKLFLDTGFIIALEAADDQYHHAALAQWQSFAAPLPILVTTSYVFDEVVTFFTVRRRPTKAAEIGNLLLNSPSVQLIHIDEALFREAWTYFMRYSDKSYSFTDCSSFIVMKRLGIVTALTFDKHFMMAGFTTLPER